MLTIVYSGKDTILKQLDRMFTPSWAKMSDVTVKRNKETLTLTGSDKAIKVVYGQTKALAKREKITLTEPKSVTTAKRADK